MVGALDFGSRGLVMSSGSGASLCAPLGLQNDTGVLLLRPDNLLGRGWGTCD